MSRCPLPLALAVSLFLVMATGESPLCADVIWTKDGRKLVGKIVEEDEKRVLIEMKMGRSTMRVPVARKDIRSLERGRTPEEEFQHRLSKLAPDDLEGHRELLEWTRKNRMVAAADLVESRLVGVERLHFKKEHPRDWCRGCDASGKRACPGCEGEGTVLQPCTRCDGKGVVPCETCGKRENARLRCRRCGGRGKIEKFNPKIARKETVECPDCKGEGDHECPSCEGDRESECSLCEGKKGLTESCPRCQGEPEETCPVCTGSRVQPKPLTNEELAAEKAAAEKAAQQKAAKEEAAKEAGGKEGGGEKPEAGGAGEKPKPEGEGKEPGVDSPRARAAGE